MRVFIFGTMIAYGVYITTKVSDHRYDLEVKVQGHIYLKSVLQLVMQILSFFDEGCSYLPQ